MNIIIAGPSRAGKTTLAKKINEELNYFIISLDKLMTVFARAYPQLDVRIAWDFEKAAVNAAPFLGHFLGMFSSDHGFAEELNLRKHAVKENRFVLEGGHFDFEKILPILKTYGIEDLKEKFILIGLMQNKTTEELFYSLKKYDTEDEWTYNFNDDELMKQCEIFVSDNQKSYEAFIKYGFSIYDTSVEREQVFNQIIKDIELKVKEKLCTSPKM